MALKQKLIAIGAEKLADMVLSLREKHKNIRRDIDTTVAGFDAKPQKLENAIKKEISALKRTSKFVSYKESADLSKRLDGLRCRISNDLFMKAPNIAFDLMLQFLDLHAHTLERSDDSGGSIGNVFIAACQDLSKLSEKANMLPSALVEIAFSRFMNNGYCILDRIIHNLKDALKKDGLLMLKSKFMLKRADNYKTGEIMNGLKAVADCLNDVDEYINVCALEGEISDFDIPEIAKRLINNNRSQEAVSWLDRVNSEYRFKERCSLRVKALESLGEQDKAQEARISWFESDLSADLYKDILKYATSDAKISFRNETMLMILSHPDPVTVGIFLMDIKEKEELSKFIRLKFYDLPSDRCGILRPIANQLQEDDPLAATLLYRKMINSVLYRANSKYKCAAKDLVTCLMLSSKISDWEGFDTHDEYFQELKKEHKFKRNFWSDYEDVQIQSPNPKRKKV